ncbi:hypothetical protein VZT92_011134 [Zoarces viviparus]|uniref:Uncharacterized protein n=1 Tax=Zoarces viviparus TaxID=48416 RepID=A0AAW1FAS5_ZOAVI
MKDELNASLNATLESCHLVGEENRKLNLLQNRSMQIIALASAENQQLHLRLNNEQQTSAQLKAENRHQLSILSSSRLSFLWSFCSKESLQCSRCIPGWIELGNCTTVLPGHGG